MLLYRKHNPPPALQTVIVASLTSFPAHDLGADTGRGHRVLPTEKSSGAIRSLQLPFATVPLLHDILAAK
jgi:hypothetical protein